MSIRLHRCRFTFLRSDRFECYRVQKALDDEGGDYEIVKSPYFPRSRRREVERLTGQRLLPVIELRTVRPTGKSLRTWPPRSEAANSTRSGLLGAECRAFAARVGSLPPYAGREYADHEDEEEELDHQPSRLLQPAVANRDANHDVEQSGQHRGPPQP